MFSLRLDCYNRPPAAIGRSTSVLLVVVFWELAKWHAPIGGREGALILMAAGDRFLPAA